jgi:thermitase
LETSDPAAGGEIGNENSRSFSLQVSAALSKSPLDGRLRVRAPFIPDEILVTRKADYSDEAIRHRLRSRNYRIHRRIDFRRRPKSRLNRTYLIQIPEGKSVEEAMAEFEADPAVESSQPYYRYRLAAAPEDTFFALQWAHQNLGGNSVFQPYDTLWGPDPRVAGADMKTIEAFDSLERQGVTPDPVIVAEIDSGIDTDHPDLAGVALPGLDYIDGDADPMDGNGHGTHVSGIIAGLRNDIGIYGTTSNARILPIRVFGDAGESSSAGAISGITYAIDQGASIINASWSSVDLTDDVDDALKDAVLAARDAGVLVVAASYVMLNLVADVLQALLDPRVKV